MKWDFSPLPAHTHTHTHSCLVSHLFFLAFLGLAYLRPACLFKQEMGTQNAEDGIKRTSMARGGEGCR